MATWKKVLTEDSSVNLSQLITSTHQVIISDGSGDAAGLTIANGNILVGNGSGEPVAAAVTGGDVTGAFDASGNYHLTIGTDTVDQAMFNGKVIDTTELVDQAGHGIMVYDDSGTDGTGVGTFLAGGTAGQVLKVNSTANGFTFGAQDSAATSDIAAVTGSSGKVPVIFGKDAGNNGTDDSGATLGKQGAADEFTYEPDVSSVTASNFFPNNFAGSAISPVLHSGATHALKVAGGIEAHLSGTAAHAATVVVAESAADAFYNIPFVNGTSGMQAIGVDSSGLQYNPAEETLKVKNIQITGTNVSVDTTNLLIEDHTIRLGTSAASTTAADAQGTGIVVNIGVSDLASGDENNGTLNQTNDDDHLPRLIWGDENLSESTLGWQVATVGGLNAGVGVDTDNDGVNDAPDNTHDASVAYGVAVLKHVTDDITVASALEAGGDHAHDIGVGAFFLATGGDGNLYIQTA